MLISTRGRYALRFLVDLAENGRGEYITTQELADRQAISKKYAERLMAALSRGGFISARHGVGGGCRLAVEPDKCRVSDVLAAMNEDIAPVACLSCEPNECPRAGECRTLPMWEKLGGIIQDFFDGITIADLMKQSETPL
ncbi:MAG: Rrf2 family transcriptional regulator [Synergistaceae bacterium]|nr:Rrf2 family transcriptional regulator [Synergistaceae bacterium]